MKNDNDVKPLRLAIIGTPDELARITLDMRKVLGETAKFMEWMSRPEVQAKVTEQFRKGTLGPPIDWNLFK